MTGELFLVTGPRGSGKTTWCSKLAGHERKQGKSVVGLLSPAVIVGHRKVAIDLVDLTTGESRRLSSWRSKVLTDEATTLWRLDHTTLAWANRILRELPVSDLIILDELGPVEFLDGNGLQEGLHLIDNRRFAQSYVVVCPELLSIAVERWPWARVLKVVNGEVIEGSAECDIS